MPPNKKKQKINKRRLDRKNEHETKFNSNKKNSIIGTKKRIKLKPINCVFSKR